MKIIAWCKGKFRLYAVFSKSILFILGLVFSYNLVEKVFFDILITHLTELKDHHLRRAVTVVNLQEGTSAALQIFFAFLADAYTGLFNMVVGSSTLHIIGLFLTYYAARNGNRSLDIRVFYPALVLMTLSQAAYMITLKSFLGDQLVAGVRQATQEEEENAKKRSNLWWNNVSILAFIFALFGPLGGASFRDLSFVLAITMGGTFLWFLLGIGTYLCRKRTDSPLSDVVFVIYSAIIKRNVKYPERPEQIFENASDSLQILPHVPWLRWLVEQRSCKTAVQASIAVLSE